MESAEGFKEALLESRSDSLAVVGNRNDRPVALGLDAIRVTVAPGANLQQFVINLITDQALSREGFSNEMLMSRSASFELENLAAYQVIGGTQHPVRARFVQIMDGSFGLQADTYDASMPVIIDLGNPFGAKLRPDATIIARDNTVVAAGWSFYTTPSFLAKWRFGGTPVFLTMFNPVTYGHLFSDQEGNITMAATVGVSPPPVTTDAPRSTPILDGERMACILCKMLSSTFIDELGYLNLKPEQSNIFFKLMEECYRQHSTIIRTNLGYDEWPNFLGNRPMVEALLSRLRHLWPHRDHADPPFNRGRILLSPHLDCFRSRLISTQSSASLT